MDYWKVLLRTISDILMVLKLDGLHFFSFSLINRAKTNKYVHLTCVLFVHLT